MAGPAGGGDRAYKRSWKNLLINKRYQLQFTLFMVGLSSLLMIGLGIWVMKEANEGTKVGMASVRGGDCGPLEVVPPKEDDVRPTTPMHLDDGDGSAAAAGSASGSADASGSDAATSGSASGGGSATDDRAAGSAAAEPAHRRPHVQLDNSEMTMVPQPEAILPAKPVLTAAELATRLHKQQAEVFGNRVCAIAQQIQFEHLEFGRLRIFIVLLLTGLALVVGLAVYGIKMTHKVAGPLFKVGLYLNKMREGRFDKVWNLRKGDQLVDFYEHFKAAHAGMVTLEKTDIERIQAVIAAAEASGLGAHASIASLRAVLARKEKALV